MVNQRQHSKDKRHIACRIMQQVSQSWHASNGELDKLLSDGTEATWITLQAIMDKDAQLDLDTTTLLRISYVFRINRALEQLYDTSESLIEFLNTPNQSFDDRAPLALKLGEGEAGLETVHDHLFKHFNGINP